MASFSHLFGASSHRIAEADSVAVIGLGRFGSSLALELVDAGTEVLGIDSDEDIVQSMNGRLTQVVRADSTRREALEQLAVPEFDRVVIAIGDEVQASILTASLLIQMRIPVVWAKAVSEQHGLILEQLGVHHVIYPEKDMGRRVAHLVRGAALDYLEIDRGYALVKTSVPERFRGVALGQAGIRRGHGVTVAAYRRGSAEWSNADTDTVLHGGDTVLVVGPTRRVEEFAQLR